MNRDGMSSYFNTTNKIKVSVFSLP
jgi:hypothetical protein